MRATAARGRSGSGAPEEASGDGGGAGEMLGDRSPSVGGGHRTRSVGFRALAMLDNRSYVEHGSELVGDRRERRGGRDRRDEPALGAGRAVRRVRGTAGAGTTARAIALVGLTVLDWL